MTLKKSHFILIAIFVATLAFLAFKLNSSGSSQGKPANEQAATDDSVNLKMPRVLSSFSPATIARLRSCIRSVTMI